MAKKSKKGKPKTGGSVKKAKKTTTKKAAAKPKKGGSVKGALKSVGGIINRGIETYTGSSVSGVVSDFKKGKGGTPGRKRRRGVVPKVVRKWSSKMASRRKQEEKIVKKLFGSDGGKILKKPKVSRGGSPGFITAAEAREAMRR